MTQHGELNVWRSIVSQRPTRLAPPYGMLQMSIAMPQSATEIQARFIDEQRQIREYVSLISSTLKIDETLLSDFNHKLKWAELPLLPTRASERFGKPYNHEEASSLQKGIATVHPMVESFAASLDASLRELESQVVDLDSHLHAVDMWADHFAAVFLTTVRSPQERQQYFDQMVRTFPVDRFVDMFDEIQGILSAPPDEAELNFRMRYIGQGYIQGQRQCNSRLLENFSLMLDWFERFRVICKMIANDAAVNLHRQAFLLLMTAFDAAVFDLTRAGILNRFVERAPKFAGRDKFSVAEIATWIASGDLNGVLTDGILRSKRLQSLLEELEGYTGQLSDVGNGMTKDRLIELVRRRNIHVHRRGEVDTEYASKFNFANLSVGEIAPIDDHYFQEANDYCAFCVNKLVLWANTP